MKRCRKIKHNSQWAANKASKILFDETGLVSKPYKCPKCKKWHIGKPSFYDDPKSFFDNIKKMIEDQNKMIMEVNK